MVVVLRRIVGAGGTGEGRVGLWLVALQAQRVALQSGLRTVRVVAVRAGHAHAVHLALAVRADDEDLVQLLAVGVVQALAQQAGQVIVQVGLAWHRRGA